MPPRQWDVTLARTRELWGLAQKRHTKTLVEDLARKYGLRDPYNDYYVRKVHVALAKLPPEEFATLCNRLNQERGLKLFNPMLRLKGEYPVPPIIYGLG